MIAGSAAEARVRRVEFVPEMLLQALLLILSVAAVAAVVTMGIAALAIPVLVGSVVLAVVAPYRLGLLLLGAAVVLDPGAVDFSGEIAPLLYQLPPGVELPITVSPAEIAIVVAFLSALLHRPKDRALDLPWVAALLPLAIVGGFLQGWRLGGEMNIAYNEARGLLYGAAAFGLVVLAPRSMIHQLRVVLVASTAALGAILVYRYLAYVRTDRLEIPIEFAFAHENSIMLGAGMAYGLTWLARPGLSLRDRLLLLAYVALMMVALAATQRRAATLVALVGMGTVGMLLLTRRPALVIAAAVPLSIVAAFFLAATWDREYGATAQPARAIRSQIDPSPRDESSDLYRDLERSNVIETVRVNRVLGVGFGRPFAQYQSLPNLESFWPLQTYTPHQNILWLWLKMGLVGLSAFLALVALALSRALAVVRSSRTLEPRVALGIVVAATLLMYLAFATVDLALVGARGSVPLAVALGVAFALPRPSEPREREPAE